ncbi:class I SAM-dependent methyltransferase [Salegentibacter mishustinae]|uniref:SAM-dependent methyltransferase n=1 Tax=Salegentibacter mishustinae TaxID=270918 RepID=A0A0Q9ZM19_9FLAO|nr:class I SAM-dependent methyltransferase [Salegentibacter mishustinae]KRG30212.1 SAM-dependent methyltransferase [Salegentibacter mishustinae]PNW19406.1 SAM-dependent methyltransferase [Salegentibacter mishustinae]PZX62149.1 methyltransferase family protein [Salegentibacter mishustinae]GGW94111.1 methyltransferase [Salegentibacter mishustinae]
MKDNFSSKSSSYAKYRPTYPQELYQFLKEKLHKTEKAWDCGTGNGQVAGALAKFFKEVQATDISQQQLDNAIRQPNIHYSVQAAEKTNFPDNSFDLITVAQAIHWFNFEAFYKEVARVLKPDGIIAVIGYSLFKSNPETDEVILKFYHDIVGPFWDEERKYLDKKYKTIPFPFIEIESPRFKQEYQWTFTHLIGYLKTWSAVKHYEKANGENPVDLIEEELKATFGAKNKVVFPILFRLGKLAK